MPACFSTLLRVSLVDIHQVVRGTEPSAYVVYVELSRRANRDLRGIKSVLDRGRIRGALGDLAREPQPGNLDVRSLRGHAPWRRLRVGDYRLLFRSMTVSELHGAWAQGIAAERGMLVVRIVPRRDFERVVSRLR